MAAYFSPAGNEQQSDQNGAPVSGALITTYAAGTTTPITTYTDSAGLVPQTNPIVCNSSGYPSSSIYLPAGQAVKLVFTTSIASGSVAYRPALDNLTGINDPAAAGAVTEWTAYTGTVTYVSGTSFSVAGDQTGTFQVLRRLKSTNTSGTIYSTISASSYNSGTARTTVTVTNDSGTLDSGLSAVSYGLLSATNASYPSQFIGIAQTWQNVGASRATGTNYTNSTGKPIMVAAAMTSNNGSAIITATVGGVTMDGSGGAGVGQVAAIQFIVPTGVTYSVTMNLGTPAIATWFELR